MPIHKVTATLVIQIDTQIDPDQLSDFDGDSAETEDVKDFLKDTLSDPDTLGIFFEETGYMPESVEVRTLGTSLVENAEAEADDSD